MHMTVNDVESVRIFFSKQTDLSSHRKTMECVSFKEDKHHYMVMMDIFFPFFLCELWTRSRYCSIPRIKLRGHLLHCLFRNQGETMVAQFEWEEQRSDVASALSQTQKRNVGKGWKTCPLLKIERYIRWVRPKKGMWEKAGKHAPSQ